MNSRNYGLYALALAVVVVGGLWLGLPVGTLVLLSVVLVCPLMMIMMLRGMHGGNERDQNRPQQHDPADRNEPHDHPRAR